MFVILCNTVWIAVETDHNKEDNLCKAALVFQLVDNLFCFIFTAEISVRFLAFKNKCNAFLDSWFVFDASLATLMVWETWIMVLCFLMFGMEVGGKAARDSQALRMLRLVRLVRVARATR